MARTKKLNNKRRKIVSRKLNYNKKKRVSRGKGKRNRKNTRLRKKKQIYIGGAAKVSGTNINFIFKQLKTARNEFFKSLEAQIELKSSKKKQY